MHDERPVLAALDFRLSYGDCDPAGIVYYAAYYPWMERVYTEWTHTGGFDASRMREAWGATHVSRASGCDYYVPGELFDPLRCEMRLRGLGDTSFVMDFPIVHRERDELVAQGHIVFVFVDDDFRSTAVPEGLRVVLRNAGYEV
jgi:acyl-CoA thioester hydrolase